MRESRQASSLSECGHKAERVSTKQLACLPVVDRAYPYHNMHLGLETTLK
jgi:hypothetical protein